MNRWLDGRALVLTLSLVVACKGGAPSTTGDTDAAATDTDADTDVVAEVPLERAHAGGSPSAVQVVGRYAYVAVGAHLEVWDLQDPEGPIRVGESAPLGGLIAAIAVAGERAYVVEQLDLDGLVHVFDVSDPARIAAVGSFRAVPTDDYALLQGLAAADGELYAADQERGILVFDLTDPDLPVAAGRLGSSGVTAVRVVGGQLHYTSESYFGARFGVIDLATGAELRSAALIGAQSAALVNDRVVTTGAGGAVVYAFSDEDPGSAGEIYRYEGLSSRSFASAGTTAWIAAADGLHTLDLSDPAAIVRGGPLDLPTAGGDALAVGGDLLTVATERGTLLTVDVSAPLDPIRLGAEEMSACSGCASLDVAPDGTLVVADLEGGLRTGDIGTLAGEGRSTPAAARFEAVTVEGGLAFVADGLAGLRVFDVGDPAAPRLVSTLATGGYASSVAASGDRVVVGESTSGGAIRVIDVSDPAEPRILGSAATSQAQAVELRGERVYVADTSLGGALGGLRIFDVSDPTAIAELGHYASGCTSAVDVAVEGDLALLACGPYDFQLVDVSDPAAPASLALWIVEGVTYAGSVALDGDRAWLGADAAVIALDISDPALPSEIVSWPVASAARAIAVPYPGRVIAACGPGGLYQWDLDE